MPALLAEQRLRDHGQEMTAEGLRQAVLDATGNADLADELYCQRVLAETPR